MNRLLLISLSVLLALPLVAHDLWIQPDRFVFDAGEAVRLRLFVGDPFTPETEIANETRKVIRFEAAGPNGAVEPVGTTTRLLAPLPLKEPGTYTIVLERQPSLVTLNAARFRDYLKEEGHDQTLAAFRTAGLKEARERFSRHLKTIVRAGSAGGDSYARRFGTKLEIVPMSDPATLGSGDSLPVEVFLDGAPLPQARIVLWSRNGTDIQQHETVRTDADGRVVLRIPRTGEMLVRTSTIRPCKGCADAEYESFWSSLTFSVE